LQIGIARRAADRIAAKLEEARGQGEAIDMEEEFRLLTLQVIGEAVLSLPPEQCDRVRLISPPLIMRSIQAPPYLLTFTETKVPGVVLACVWARTAAPCE
jgi:cytochrome P450